MSNPISYMERTRLYYEAQGFEHAYQWAHYDDIPFTLPGIPLNKSRVAILTTAISNEDVETPMVGRTAHSYPISRVPENFFTDDLSWDKVTTHTDDRGSYFPLEPLERMVEEGRIGTLAPRYHFVPTEYSKRHTLEHDAPQIRDACLEDEVDVAILVPL